MFFICCIIFHLLFFQSATREKEERGQRIEFEKKKKLKSEIFDK